MLVLSRSVGEDLQIGDAVTVRLAAIDRRELCVQLRVTNRGVEQSLWLPLEGGVLVADHVAVHLCRLKRHNAWLGIVAPRELLVTRVSPETKRAASRLEEILRRRKSG